VIIARNANGQATGVTTKQNATAAVANVATGIAYRPMSSLITAMTHGNGLITNAGYDLDERLTSLAVKNGAVNVQAYAYAYGDSLNLTGITDQVVAANSNTLSYSPANRLASASGAWGANTFTYDSVGNRLTDVTAAANRVASYSTTSNRITGMTQGGAAFRTYTYDGAGNIITDLRPGPETFTYGYNSRNRLASVTRNSAAYATYVYNAMEQMVSRNSAAVGAPVGTVHYIYDTDGHLIAEADAATGATTREYIWLPGNDMQNDTMAESMGLAANDNVPDLPLAVVNVSATPVIYQVHTDHLGRPIRMTDAVKATVWAATWKPWGEVQSITGTQSQNLRFPGQYFQIETGLAYNWHRHYDPVTGRYTQPDPLRFVDGPSIYQYAMASPFMRKDRMGLAVFVNNSKVPILVLGTPGLGHGHPDNNRDDDEYVPILVPPGGRIDRCHPGIGPNGEKVYDVDAIDRNGDGKVRGSPYDPRNLFDLPFAANEYLFRDQVAGGDTSPIYVARPTLGPSGRGYRPFYLVKLPGPVDTRSCTCGAK
jgi:RHS repeat-associated protein